MKPVILDRVTEFLLYTCGFFLLLEWLFPVEELTDTGNIWAFMLFLLLSLVFSYLKIHYSYRVLVKTAYVLFILQHLYFEGAFFDLGWLRLLISDFVTNVGHLVFFRWEELTDMFRSILFFILIGLMTYLMNYWLVVQRRILVFFVMTLIYITVLDTFTSYDATFAIIRTVVIGFFLLGLLNFLRMAEKENISRQTIMEKIKGWLIPLVLLIAGSTFLAFVTPKSEPRWPDPIPYLESVVSGIKDGTMNTGSNYHSDDSKLGGPFRGNDKVIYKTETAFPHYWRVETKDVYTGKGWVSSREDQVFPLDKGMVPFSPYDVNFTAKENQTGRVEVKTNAPHLIYPFGVRKINSDADVRLETEVNLEKITPVEESRRNKIREYAVFYEAPVYDPDILRSIPYHQILTLDRRFLNRYTQLPANLPVRVRELAYMITMDAPTIYDKAKAIEHFFETNGFIYDQTNVAVPGQNDDYVDQFLFETKIGYCDNYSTSMVVLLRSIGLPARWVKGYTEGEYRGTNNEGWQKHEITNNNAHSWVEVYFPEIGWVPFEPTIGFTGDSDFQEEEILDETGEEEMPAPIEEQEEDPQDETSDEDESAAGMQENGFVKFAKKALAVLGGILAAAAIVLFFTRKRWFPYYYVTRFRNRTDNEAFLDAYPILLKHLDRWGLKRSPDVTLREYAQVVDEKILGAEMRMMTRYYEQYLYKGVLEEGAWNKVRQAWEKIMKTIP